MRKAALIHADRPFDGALQSTVTINDHCQIFVDYSGGMSVSEYAKDRGYNLKIISLEQADQLFEKYYASLVTEPKEIDEDRFMEMLEVLPPCRWHNCGGFEVFHVSERYTGELVSWFAHNGGQYWEFMDYSYASDQHLAEKLRAAMLKH